ncbi:hypothetical protein L3V83_15175 [Thiotrichales bacterium 19X7-9]|nr:hypothetical protein [Thiotrichales bacterium 19X7-9]
MTNIVLSEKELEFLSQAALVFDGAIADECINLNHIAEVATFIVGICGKNAKLTDTQKQALRDAYSVLQKISN